MDNKNSISRRSAITGMGAICLTTAFTPVLGADFNIDETSTASYPEDPKTKYPRPPFKEQKQPWPGLVSKMDPRPDHGEKSYKGSGRLKGRKALITGGDSGMGRAAAIAYAREGADVAINYYPTEEEDAKEVIQLIKAEGRKAVAIPGDLRDESFCKSLVDQAVKALGGLDIVINNAARQQTHESILDISTEDFDATMKTNIYAPFWIIKAALPHLKPGSSIIGTSSVQAYAPTEDLYDYAQTKAATTNYIKSLAKQLAPKGIRVNGVAPGPVWTALQVSGGATMEKLKNFGSQTPMGRPGQPVELASIYVQLAAEDASYATGQIYGSSGGEGNP
ncbi:SDR family oxidoreductase [Flavobacterium foetidum]|uniref:SDR family oxidoreductase n=1 Tax=Flavobacterium foetidum TaxID=2026681 RepID=UPI0010753731|nr:SDR family oxidoreductase [Flavobacterium foetidum]KAF2515702.1 SDR family oxidoreductase [Flavobacterium foetidum]